MPRLHRCTSIDKGGSAQTWPRGTPAAVWLMLSPAVASPVRALRERAGRRTLRMQGSISGMRLKAGEAGGGQRRV